MNMCLAPYTRHDYYHGHHLSTCTNELFGEDLCAEMHGCGLKGMRSLSLNADCALGSDELHWCVV